MALLILFGPPILLLILSGFAYRYFENREAKMKIIMIRIKLDRIKRAGLYEKLLANCSPEEKELIYKAEKELGKHHPWGYL